MVITKLQVFEALRRVVLPGDSKSLVDAKRIESLKINGTNINFSIIQFKGETFDHKDIVNKCTSAIKSNISSDAIVNIDISTIDNAPEAEKKVLDGIKNIIAIASGKGGVGKSTIASNLAVALAREGYSTGLVDADIFGPSIPRMFKTEGEKSYAKKVDGRDIIMPIEKYNVKVLSIGYFVDPENATIWRGPMASNVLKQLILDAEWGELDYLLIDLPPGTSDIHITLVQTVPVTGALIVTTPQKVALADATKGINMFKSKSIKVPVIGLVENMSWFTPAELPENKYYIFGKDGGKNLAEKMNVPLIGQIPIVQSICESGDTGKPVAAEDNTISGKAFQSLANSLIEKVELRNKTMPPTEIVHMH